MIFSIEFWRVPTTTIAYIEYTIQKGYTRVYDFNKLSSHICKGSDFFRRGGLSRFLSMKRIYTMHIVVYRRDSRLCFMRLNSILTLVRILPSLIVMSAYCRGRHPFRGLSYPNLLWKGGLLGKRDDYLQYHIVMTCRSYSRFGSSRWFICTYARSAYRHVILTVSDWLLVNSS